MLVVLAVLAVPPAADRVAITPPPTTPTQAMATRAFTLATTLALATALALALRTALALALR